MRELREPYELDSSKHYSYVTHNFIPMFLVRNHKGWGWKTYTRVTCKAGIHLMLRGTSSWASHVSNMKAVATVVRKGYIVEFDTEEELMAWVEENKTPSPRALMDVGKLALIPVRKKRILPSCLGE